MLREGMAARLYEVQTSLTGLQKDLEWLDECFCKCYSISEPFKAQTLTKK